MPSPISRSRPDKKASLRDRHANAVIQNNYDPDGFESENVISITKDKAGQTVVTKTANQKLMIETLNSTFGMTKILFAVGSAGTGKTFLATCWAVEQLRNSKASGVNKIIMLRPNVEVGKSLGFMPGTEAEKFQHYTIPFVKSLKKLIPCEKLDEMIHKEVIEMSPINFLRGDTFENAVVIVDESQNMTIDEFKMILTRLGDDSRIIFTGDTSQVDLRDKKSSGLSHAMCILKDIRGINAVEFGIEDIVRDGIVKDIIIAYQNDGK